MAIPTIIGGLYGMNVMLPLGDNPNAFWIILGIITSIVIVFITYFRRNRWL
jgi:magnesium transporter